MESTEDLIRQENHKIQENIQQLKKAIDHTISGHDDMLELITTIEDNLEKNNHGQVKQNMKSLIKTLDNNINAITASIFVDQMTGGRSNDEKQYKELEDLRNMKTSVQESLDEFKPAMKNDGKDNIGNKVREKMQNTLNQVKGVFSESKQFLSSMKSSIANIIKDETRDMRKDFKEKASGVKDMLQETYNQFSDIKTEMKGTSLKAKLLAFGSVMSNIADKTILPYIDKHFPGFVEPSKQKSSQSTDQDKPQEQVSIKEQIEKAELKKTELEAEKKNLLKEENIITVNYTTLLKSNTECSSKIDKLTNTLKGLEAQYKKPVDQINKLMEEKNTLVSMKDGIDNEISACEVKNKNLFQENNNIQDQISVQEGLIQELQSNKQEQHIKEGDPLKSSVQEKTTKAKDVIKEKAGKTKSAIEAKGNAFQEKATNVKDSMKEKASEIGAALKGLMKTDNKQTSSMEKASHVDCATSPQQPNSTMGRGG